MTTLDLSKLVFKETQYVYIDIDAFDSLEEIRTRIYCGIMRKCKLNSHKTENDDMEQGIQ